MSKHSSFDVRIWNVSKYAGARRTTYTLRWRVGGQRFQRTFATSKLAESYRAILMVAARHGEHFDATTGLPQTLTEQKPAPTWVDHIAHFMDRKWPTASARHRRGLAEGLLTATLALYPQEIKHSAEARRALFDWVLNTGARRGMPLRDATPPERLGAAIGRLSRMSPDLDQAAGPASLRQILDALAVKLNGAPASASTIRRKRSALYSALDFAVELGELAANPLDRLKWRPPAPDDVVDRRVVVNPTQARALLEAVARTYPSLEAFLACMYYSALRPAEVRHLTVTDLALPGEGHSWGELHLSGSTQTSGRAWTDSGLTTEDRQLKHRSRRATRSVPAPPELVDTLRRHMDTFPPRGGRPPVRHTNR